MKYHVPAAPNSQCFTTEDVAKMKGCTPKTIMADVKAGMLIPRYPAAKKKFHITDVDRYLRGRGPRRHGR